MHFSRVGLNEKGNRIQPRTGKTSHQTHRCGRRAITDKGGKAGYWGDTGYIKRKLHQDTRDLNNNNRQILPESLYHVNRGKKRHAT